jgi:hypothetical protein
VTRTSFARGGDCLIARVATHDTKPKTSHSRRTELSLLRPSVKHEKRSAYHLTR